MASNRRANGGLAVMARRRLDDVNLRLLDELQADARLSNAELGRRVGLSAPAVAERLAAPARTPASSAATTPPSIRARSATRSPRSSGSARRRASCRRSPTSRATTREVVECHRITGEDCFFMKLHVRDVEHLEEVIDAFAFYGQTTTSILQTSPVPRRAISV